MLKHIPEKTFKFHKHKHKKSKWMTTGIIKSISFRDKLYSKLKKAHPDTLQHTILKINLSTYNNILKKNIRAVKRIYYETYGQPSMKKLTKLGKRNNFLKFSGKMVHLLVVK